MHRKAKLNIDYKILHTSEIKVIKNNMTDKLIQEELDLVLDIEEHIKDHNPHDLETPLEADNAIAEFKTYMERFKKYQTELKVALREDYGDNYPNVEKPEKRYGNISVSSKPGVRSCVAKSASSKTSVHHRMPSEPPRKMHAQPRSVPMSARSKSCV